MIRYFLLSLPLLLMMPSCNSGPGPGGQASITGKVKVIANWNPSCTLFVDSANGFTPYYGPDFDVYLIYGDDPSYGDRVKTAPDGTFQFNYLRRGKYTVYAYSKNCNISAGTEAVTLSVEITDRKQEVTTNDLRINR